MRRIKPLRLAAGLSLSGLTLLSWTMTWFNLTLDESTAATDMIEVTGETAAPALAALALAGLALVAALAIAGHVFRVILGLLQAVIGASVGWSAVSALTDPVGVSAAIVTETTGIAGGQSVAALVGTATATPWPGITVALGVLTLLCGLSVVVSSGRWPRATSRYQTTRFEGADAPRSSISDWDSLSDGSDPTSR
jgi:uncharacterized membrane protein (TIGR02234 family)